MMREVRVADHARGGGHGHGAAPRRERHGQGAGGARHPRHEPAARRGPFVKLHCAALPDDAARERALRLREGRLHRRGHAQARPGRAGRTAGTLFLDEIGDIPRRAGQAAAPAAGARVRAPRRHADPEGRRALRRRDPPAARGAGARRAQFREDLFYRLNVVPIWLPPLRDAARGHRAAGAPLLRRCGEANGAAALTLTRGRARRLQAQPWPGNVRQLQNFIERLVVLSDGATLDRRRRRCASWRGGRRWSSPPTRRGAAPSARPGADAGRRRRERWRPAAATPSGTRSSSPSKSREQPSKAARLLGISRRGLYHKLGEHGLL